MRFLQKYRLLIKMINVLFSCQIKKETGCVKSHGSRWVLGAELCRVVLNHGGSEACGYSPREGVFGNPRHSVNTLLGRVRQVVI